MLRVFTLYFLKWSMVYSKLCAFVFRVTFFILFYYLCEFEFELCQYYLPYASLG